MESRPGEVTAMARGRSTGDAATVFGDSSLGRIGGDLMAGHHKYGVGSAKVMADVWLWREKRNSFFLLTKWSDSTATGPRNPP